MKKLAVLIGILLILFRGITVSCAQTPEQVAAAKKAGVTPGVPLPTGLGFFTNPDNFHRFTIGLQAGVLGANTSSATFGYDNLSVSSKWRLGTNKFGRHLHVLVGFSDWREPAYRQVFADSVIAPLPKQDRFSAKSANAASVGLAYSYGRELLDYRLTSAQLDSLTAYQILIQTPRLPTFLQASAAAGASLSVIELAEVRLMTGRVTHISTPLTQEQIDSLANKGFTAAQQTAWQTGAATKTERLNLLAAGIKPRLVNALSTDPNSPALQTHWAAQRDAFLLAVYRAKAREKSFSLGVLLRAASFAEETNIQAFDSYVTYTKGYKTCDFVGAIHYLDYIEKALPRYAVTGAVGVFIDLDDTSIFPVLGLTASYGYYAFRELDAIIADAPKRSRDPITKRWDVLLSIAGAPDKTNQTGAGIGIRYSYVAPSLLPACHAFSLVLSSNFSLIK